MRARRIPALWLLALLILAAAAGLRLTDLAWMPLGEAEARAALNAISATPNASAFWQAAAQPQSAAYTSLAGLLFVLFGAGDGLARLAPALAGLGIVALPLLFRRDLGWPACLGAMSALAISSAALFSARSAHGASFAVLAIAVLLWAARRRTTADSGWAIAAGVALGLALSSGPTLWMGVFGLGLGLLLWRLVAGQVQTGPPLEPQRLLRSQVLAVAAFVFLLLATSFGTRLEGIAAALASPGDWLAGWLEAGELGLLTAAALILLYEPLLLFGGLLGAWADERPRAPFLRLLPFWAVGALVAFLVYPGREPIDLIWVALPASFLVGLALAGGLRRYRGDQLWSAPTLLTGLLLLLFAFAYLQLQQVGAGLGMTQLMPNQQLLYGLAAVVFIAALILLFGLGWSWRATGLALASFAVISLAAVNLSAAWSLTHDPDSGARELWRPRVTTENMRLLEATLTALSNAHTGTEQGLAVALAGQPPDSLAWVLRGHDAAAIRVAEGEQPPPLILAAERTEPLLPADYVGQAFAVYERKGWPGALPPNLARWWLAREAPTEPLRWVMYVRTDVAGFEEEEVPAQGEGN